MSRRKFYESDSPSRWTLGIMGQILLVVLAMAAIIALIWGIRVATSDVRGQGDSEIIKNEARNRIRAQEGFEQRYADIKATDLKLDVLAEAAKSGDKTAQDNLVGTQSYCLSVVGDYNAAARKFTSEEFRSADLPYEIDLNLPSTDCKPKE